MYTVSFTDAAQALQTADGAISISEGHGCLCGALCTLPQFSSQSWLQEMLPDPASELVVPAAPLAAPLQQLYGETVASLRGDEMGFNPLLPDDETPIAERIAALAQWSQGFLYGFGIGVPQSIQGFPGEVGEVLKDLSEIARADETDSTGSEEEEDAYAELVEYLRAAVQLIHDELAEQRAIQAQHSPPHAH